MVHGITLFRQYFQNYTGQYIFIGGTACDLILGEKNVDFRATKDLDLVLIVEAVSEKFIDSFVKFIQDGRYSHMDKGTGDHQFYRFEKPENHEFPAMIELFSRKPDYMLRLENHLAPIHISDDVVSLSAILLDDDYYSLLKEGMTQVEGITVLKLEYLILFKMKAYLDLSRRRDSGEHVDAKNIKKHKNDVIRLGANIDPGSHVIITGQVRKDAEEFIEKLGTDPVNARQLGVNADTKDIITRIADCFGIE